MKLIKRLSILLVVVLSAIGVGEFIASNRDPVTLTFFFKSIPSYPVYRIVIAAFLGGAVLVAALVIGDVVSLHLKSVRQRRQIEHLEKTLAERDVLRAPIGESEDGPTTTPTISQNEASLQVHETDHPGPYRS